jgi:hypothetical protein
VDSLAGCDVLKMINSATQILLTHNICCIVARIIFLGVECSHVICFRNPSLMLLEVTANVITIRTSVINSCYWIASSINVFIIFVFLKRLKRDKILNIDSRWFRVLCKTLRSHCAS